jgi:Tfp pilus assembly PilM family ATPase
MSDGKQNMDLFLQVMDTTGLMKDEIKKLMIYWKTHGTRTNGGEPIRKIVFCGSNSALPSFDEYFEAMSGVPVEIANPWKNSFSFDEYIPPISRKDSLDYVTAIGLSMIS